ncbi:hypothetical protein D9M73_81840 [compost metagenome]
MLIELADTTVHVARKLRAYSQQAPEIVTLSPLECLVLLHVHRHPGVSPTALAHELALRSSNAATALRGLIKKGQVERTASAVDKRASCLHLTPAAQKAIVTVRRTWLEAIGQVEISEAELRVATHALGAINDALAEP